MNRISRLIDVRRLAIAAGAASFLLVSLGAQAQQRSLVTTHVPDVVASGVAPLVGHLFGDERLSLAISLPLTNQDDLDRLLRDIYDPQSPNYHHYLSVDEFADRFGTSQPDYAAVRHFAEANGLTVINTHANRMVVDVEGSAAAIEGAFHVTLGVFQHPTEGRTFYAPDREPSVIIDVPLLHVTGLDNYSIAQAKNVEALATPSEATGSGPNGSFLGSDLRAAYYGSGSLNGAGQTLGLFELGGYQIGDINTYFKNNHQTQKVPIKNELLNGAKLSCPPASCNDSEQALDIEQALSMAPGLRELIVYIGKNNVSIFSQMASDNTAKQLSCSWGWKDNESSLDPLFEEMAAQGQTVFVATGDQGSKTVADVVWPADDTYVTAVGGTVLSTASAGGAWKSESGWINSAGMPSPNNVPIPSYQQLPGVVNSTNDASSTLRNIPDVASESNAVQYVCANAQCKEHGGGTSYAAPLWAGLIAMVNQQAATNGQPTVGFINPMLYTIGTGSSYDSDFHDITTGSNGGYAAVTGYDLVTGWGSPIGADLISALAPPRK